MKLCSARTCSTCSRSDTTICALQNLASTPRSPAALSPFCCSQSLSLKGLPTYSSQLMQVAQYSCDNYDEINLLLNPSFNKYWFWFWSSWGLFIIPTVEIRKGIIAFRNQVLTIRNYYIRCLMMKNSNWHFHTGGPGDTYIKSDNLNIKLNCASKKAPMSS